MKATRDFVSASIVALLVAVAGVASVGLSMVVENAVTNGSFEDGPYSSVADPPGWSSGSWAGAARFSWDEDESVAGDRSVRITSWQPDDARWTQTIAVEPETYYLLSGWIKTKNVAHSGQTTDAGANLCLYGTWERTAGVFDSSGWTYVSMVFGSGPSTQVTVGARLGFWAGTTTGTAWFDDIQVTRIDPSDPHPRWSFLILVYDRTDFIYSDTAGTKHHVLAEMTTVERDAAAESARLFATEDIPALNSGNMIPVVEVRFAEEPLTRLSPHANGWWPGPWDTAPEVEGQYDSVIVIWDPRSVDQDSGEYIWLGSAAGLTPNNGTETTYNAVIVEAAAHYRHRNVFKHEFGHSILFYFSACGTAPEPAVTNHPGDIVYVHCPIGDHYIWVDETLDNPIPNSAYNNDSGFTHDYYSGTTALEEEPSRCLGICPTAWATGGPVSKPARKLPPFPPRRPRKRLNTLPEVAAPPSSEPNTAAPALPTRPQCTAAGVTTCLRP